jgi:hypothetical protein
MRASIATSSPKLAWCAGTLVVLVGPDSEVYDTFQAAIDRMSEMGDFVAGHKDAEGCSQKKISPRPTLTSRG